MHECAVNYSLIFRHLEFTVFVGTYLLAAKTTTKTSTVELFKVMHAACKHLFATKLIIGIVLHNVKKINACYNVDLKKNISCILS